MPSVDVEDCILFFRGYNWTQGSAEEDNSLSLFTTASNFPSLELDDPAANSATSYTPDPHAVSNAEAQFYYAGLHSRPTLLYRTSKEQWSRPRPGPWGPVAHLRLKELREVFRHPIVKVWNNDLGWKVVEVLDAHKVS